MYIYRQKDIQIDIERYIDRYIDRKIDRQIYIQIENRQTYIYLVRQTEKDG